MLWIFTLSFPNFRCYLPFCVPLSKVLHHTEWLLSTESLFYHYLSISFPLIQLQQHFLTQTAGPWHNRVHDMCCTCIAWTFHVGTLVCFFKLGMCRPKSTAGNTTTMDKCLIKPHLKNAVPLGKGRLCFSMALS